MPLAVYEDQSKAFLFYKRKFILQKISPVENAKFFRLKMSNLSDYISENYPIENAKSLRLKTTNLSDYTSKNSPIGI